MIFVKHLKFAFIEALEKLISKLIKIFTVGKCFIYLLDAWESTLPFSVVKVTLELQISVCLSVSLLQKPLSLSESLLLTIEPIDH